jgi:hypothetical protein
MKNSAVWYIMSCGPLKVNRYIEGTCSVHLQDRRISQTRNQQALLANGLMLVLVWFIL